VVSRRRVSTREDFTSSGHDATEDVKYRIDDHRRIKVCGTGSRIDRQQISTALNVLFSGLHQADFLIARTDRRIEL
jgi:hypothetical protein